MFMRLNVFCVPVTFNIDMLLLLPYYLCFSTYVLVTLYKVCVYFSCETSERQPSQREIKKNVMSKM